MDNSTLWQLILVLPWAAGALLATLPRGWDRFAGHAAAVVAAGLLALLAWAAWGGSAPEPLTIARAGRGGATGLELIFRVDGLGRLFALVTASVYLVVTVYSIGYLPHELERHGKQQRQRAFHAIMACFSGAMLGLVTSESLLQLYVFWELTSLASFLLIGFWVNEPDARNGATRALVMTFVGGLFLLAGLLLIGTGAGSWDLREVLAGGAEEAPWLSMAAVLIAIGGISKSAQFPFTSWLPAAMAAPSPVSAFLHSASLVAAGVFVLCRFFPLLSPEPAWSWSLGTGAGISVIAAGLWALRHTSIKGLLAYSTIGQYAFMLLGLAIGTPSALGATLYAFVLHASIKAGLFLVAGGVTHATGAKTFAELEHAPVPGRVLTIAGALLVLALSGVPFTAAFYYKEELLLAAKGADAWVPSSLLLAGAALAAAYSARFWVRTFTRTGTRDGRAQPVPGSMLVPIAALALAALAATVRPGWASRLVTQAARDASRNEISFEVHHELGTLAWISIGVVLAAITAYLFLRRVREWRGKLQRLPAELLLGGHRVVALYGVVSDRILELHDGDLRRYIRIVLLAIIVLFGSFAFEWQRFPATFGGPVDPILLAGLVVSIAPATVLLFTRNYVLMVVALNVTGYALALVFLRMHAPNVAIAQVLVETLAPLMFVMALRRSHGSTPETEARRVRGPNDPWRWAIAIGLGTSIGIVTYVARQQMVDDTVGAWYAMHSESLAGAKDQVAAILADFRALDTVVEALVFAVAMLGVVGIYNRRREVR